MNSKEEIGRFDVRPLCRLGRGVPAVVCGREGQ